MLLTGNLLSTFNASEKLISSFLNASAGLNFAICLQVDHPPVEGLE